MRLWRIVRRKYAAAAATGEGARLFGGRWNSRGVRVVYASTSLALAAMETFVHIEPNLLPADLVSIEGEIPDSVKIGKLDAKALRATSEAQQQLGNSWILKSETAAIFVPSAAVRGEWNVLLNPAHRDFRKIKFRRPEPFIFDARMFR